VSGDGDLEFSQEALDLITKGLNGAIGELESVSGSSTGSLRGAGFSDLALSHMEAGHGGLAADFEGFCEGWEWGVRALIMDANALAARLGLAAGMVHSEDRYWEGAFKVGANALVGNPHLSEEEVRQQGWQDILTPDAPDYSAESFRTAQQEMAQTWKDTGRSLVTEGQGGFLNDLAMDAAGVEEHQREAARDAVFGPSPQERAQQNQPSDGGEG
jgi:hypothetical protein